MKLGKKEASRWETLAELFSEFAERREPLEVSKDSAGPSEEELHPADQNLEPAAVEPDLEPEPEDTISQAETPSQPLQAEAPSPIEQTPMEVAVQFDPTIPAQAFFASAAWNGNSQVRPPSAVASLLHSKPAPAAQRDQTASAFFSQAPWSGTAVESVPTFISQDRTGLQKLMQVATRQAVSSSQPRPPALTASAPSKARLFFSQAPWKKPA